MNLNPRFQPYIHFAPTPEQDFPYYIWSYTPNTTLVEFLDKCHSRKNDVKLLCTTEPIGNITPGVKTSDLLGGWENTKVEIIHGGHGDFEFEQKFLLDHDPFSIMSPTRYFFPLYFLYHTFYEYSSRYSNRPNIEYSPGAHFTCYNRNPRAHRLILLHYLNEEKVLDSNYYSYIYTNYNRELYELMYTFDFTQIKIKENNLEEKSDVDTNYYSLHSSYLNSAFQLVTETSDDIIFLTEKTFYPILTKKPFIIFGAPYTNKVLEKFGFKLYTDVFDYSFDEVLNTEERAKLISKEVHRVCKEYSPTALYDKLQVTAEHNYKTALDILNNKKYIPKKFLEWERVYRDNSIWKNHIASWYYGYTANINNYL